MNFRVIYIGGSGRSGSTLLDRVIGQLPDVVSVGELLDVWRAGVVENRLCGCGAAFADCPFWRGVGEAAYGGWSAIDPVEADRLMKSIGYVSALRGRFDDADHDARSRLLVRLYTAIAATSGATTIVDSSKSPPYGMLLASALPVPVGAIHLVRDSRGLAYSWSKIVKRPDTPGRDVEMLRLSPASVAVRWAVHNTSMEIFARRVPATRMRYETFLQQPRSELRRALVAVGRATRPDELTFISDSQVVLRPNHTVMGNPMRLATGEVPLRIDQRWKDELPRLDKVTVTGLTLPWLVRYGYRP
jgi:hypothetical protein